MTSRSKLRARKSVSQNVAGSSSAISANVAPPGEELVAVGAGQALDALLGEERVEQAAGAAVGVGDEDPLVAVGAGLADPVADLAGIRSGRLWRSGERQATSTPGRPPVTRHELAGERPAADHERAALPGDRRRAWSASRTNGRSAGRRDARFGRVLRRAVRLRGPSGG